MKDRLLLFSALLAVVVAPSTDAAFRCFDDSQFPKAIDLYQEKDALHALLAGPQTDEEGRGPVVRLAENGKKWVG
ncbi:hypothetical protein [Thiohalomonas denitrificans]|uniref:Uncharacterized protein n=1 Tax=Thiohalomonas denitrificans TaxID=415747 RepID=A0A1G5QCW1_9GAMM|nr:hypothetical protein [Thiohalomonas denitrificans]SCZ59340.1 hypothetical protein SAMN03097708_01843 [Thiohalomonas denitrificans]